MSNIHVIAIPTNQEQDRKKKKTLEETMAAIFPNVVNLNIQDDLLPRGRTPRRRLTPRHVTPKQ